MTVLLAFLGAGAAGSGRAAAAALGARNDSAMPPGYKRAPSLYDWPMNKKPQPALRPRRAALRRPLRVGALAALIVGIALSLPAAAQPRIAQGSLLVATDDIDDPSWSQTVVLVLHHDSNGTLGVAINRPTEVPPQEVAPDLGEVPGFEGQVFRGGPVRPTQLVFLVRNPPAGMLSNAPRILEGIYASGDLAVLPRIVEAGGGSSLRLYAGHVEWAPGQLDREIADDRWIITAGSPDRVFTAEPSLLWQRLRNLSEELLVEERAAGSANELLVKERPAEASDDLPAQTSAADQRRAEPLLGTLSATMRPRPAASPDPR